MKDQDFEEEPRAWMLKYPTQTGDTGWRLSWTRSGAGVCNRLPGEDNEIALYVRKQPNAEVTGGPLAARPVD